MAEDFDIKGHRDDWAYWLIIKALTISGKIDEVIANRPDEKHHQIEFKVNGVELPFVAAIQDIKNEIDRMVAKKAGKIIQEKFMNFDDFLYKLKEHMLERLEITEEDLY